jgi:hypothetical protein
MNSLLEEMKSNLIRRLMSDPDHLEEAKDYLNSALGHTGEYALMGVQAMVETGASKKDILEALQETPLHDLPHTLALAELARTEALVSIAQDLRYILGTIRDEGVVTK